MNTSIVRVRRSFSAVSFLALTALFAGGCQPDPTQPEPETNELCDFDESARFAIFNHAYEPLQVVVTELSTESVSNESVSTDVLAGFATDDPNEDAIELSKEGDYSVQAIGAYSQQVLFDDVVEAKCGDSTSIDIAGVAFQGEPVALEFVADGSGELSSPTPGFSCDVSCSGTLPVGTAVTISAEAAPGFEFVGWIGIPQCENTFSNQCTFNVNPDVKSYSALFLPVSAKVFGNDFENGFAPTADSSINYSIEDKDGVADSAYLAVPTGRNAKVCLKPLDAGVFAGREHMSFSVKFDSETQYLDISARVASGESVYLGDVYPVANRVLLNRWNRVYLPLFLAEAMTEICFEAATISDSGFFAIDEVKLY